MSVGRWLRNKGFAFTADQRFARWEDIGGPGRYEKWMLQGPFEFTVVKVLTALTGVAGALVMGWLLARGREVPNPGVPVAAGMLIGTVIVLFVAPLMWKRERDLYDAWLNKQERRRQQARRASQGTPAP